MRSHLKALLAISALVLLVAPSSMAADTTPPVVTTPADIAVVAPDASGIVVTFADATAVDDIDGPVPATCDHKSGDLFPAPGLGELSKVTTVTCTATDNAGNVGTKAFTVTVTLPVVLDTVPPVVTVPADQVATTTGTTAVVNYPPATANDNVDGPLTPDCQPASGSSFPVKQTVVTCTATDQAGNTGSNHFNVTVTFDDTIPPVVHVPADQTVGATTHDGANVSFAVTATDNVDGALTPSCQPASGSLFRLGPTDVTCTATDHAGNTGSARFRVTVNDAAPTFSGVPANIVTEANGPAGSVVTYTPPSATDIVDGGLQPKCLPDSGATFPLGATTVNCTATNSSNQKATASFTVTVLDRTPPTLAAPGSITLAASGSVPASDPHIVAYLALKAQDLVDPSPTVTNDAPAVFPQGTTVVQFTAVDSSGNKVTATGQVHIVQPAAAPPTGQPAPPAPVAAKPLDRTAPGNVIGLSVTISGRAALLRWHLPSDADFDHLQISRARGNTKPVVIYKGKAISFTDHRLVSGIQYRYLIVSVDKTGNQSIGVAALATARRIMLYAPGIGARVSTPVILRWRPSVKSSFYNVQLYRRGKKIFSSFPGGAKLIVPSKWKYGGRAFILTPGRYDWYVWPARGTRRKPLFAPLEGFSAFTVVKR